MIISPRLPILLCLAAALSSVACASSLFSSPSDAPHGAPAAQRFAPVDIVLQNGLSSAFRLQSVEILLDRAPLLAEAAPAVSPAREPDDAYLEAPSFPAFSGVLREGDHVLQVRLLYRGHGSGVFSYLRGYKFEVRSSHAFHVDPQKPLDVLAVAYEKGGVTTPLEERPAVRYVEQARRAPAAIAEP